MLQTDPKWSKMVQCGITWSNMVQMLSTKSSKLVRYNQVSWSSYFFMSLSACIGIGPIICTRVSPMRDFDWYIVIFLMFDPPNCHKFSYLCQRTPLPILPPPLTLKSYYAQTVWDGVSSHKIDDIRKKEEVLHLKVHPNCIIGWNVSEILPQNKDFFSHTFLQGLFFTLDRSQNPQ